MVDVLDKLNWHLKDVQCLPWVDIYSPGSRFQIKYIPAKTDSFYSVIRLTSSSTGRTGDAFFWKFNTNPPYPPPHRNANNVESYIFVRRMRYGQGSTLTFKSTCPIGQVLEKVTCPHFLPVARFTAQQQTVIIWEEVRHVT